MSEVQLDSAAVHGKLAKIAKTWNKVSGGGHYDGVRGEKPTVGAATTGTATALRSRFPDFRELFLIVHITILQVYQEKENAQASAPDALLVVMGKVREDPIRIQSVDFL